MPPLMLKVRVDHDAIVSPDLDSIRRAFQAVGLDTVYGGTHAEAARQARHCGNLIRPLAGLIRSSRHTRRAAGSDFVTLGRETDNGINPTCSATTPNHLDTE